MHNVYIGGVDFSVGELKPIENAISDVQLSQTLRADPYNLNTFSYYNGDILELVATSVHKSLQSSKKTAQQIEAVYIFSNSFRISESFSESDFLEKFYKKTGLNKTAIPYLISGAACAGFHWLLKTANESIAINQYNSVLLVCFDSAVAPLQRFYQDDPNFLYVTGDASSSCVLSTNPEAMQYKILPSILNVVDLENLYQPSLGRELKNVSELFAKIYKLTNTHPLQITKFIGNNYSNKVSNLYSQLAKLSLAHSVLAGINTYGHCFASDNLINLKLIEKEKVLKNEERLLTFSTGPYQWGAAIIEVL